MPELTLVIGNKAFSSWSLRPWLALKHTGRPYEEIVIPLRQPDTAARIAEHSPSGRVPCLRHGDRVVWDSLAICEYLAEIAPEAGLWPEDAHARAVARSVSAEMHSGFVGLRTHMSMDLKAMRPGVGRNPESEADIARVLGLWRATRERFGAEGPFLFGRFSIADAMYAPVVTRFITYGVEMDAVGRAYAEAVMALPAMKEWVAAAKAEPWDIYADERPAADFRF
ncbi:glutathione S-transferase family protein [Azospirillum rugosum]|uniref:Glutathione S-transferase n=1 Tax=Azospirillum rugosum TaxID=416170 RepID=A0ABS4SSS2_9PROT|nr:glutathione S-transferase family protein [Azospirillum rugosum]MBP2295148.1 glutathione S-transferase [Azospirillum rugosum]MDQ0528522.1 glutathione S-transferase [Azospirillum rugosum]